MNFKKIIVHGKAYGDSQDISLANMKKYYPAVNNVDFRDSAFLNNLLDDRIQTALRVLYLCHEILVTIEEEDGSLHYSSGSPDEISLANFAKLCGKQLVQEEGEFVRIYDRRTSSTLRFRKMAVLEFNSDRKRMSVVVQLPSGEYEILTKGADSVIEGLLAPRQSKLQMTKEHLEDFSTEGLRTLLLARRSVPEAEFKTWFKRFKEAQASIKDRQQNLSRVYEQIEKDLELVGGTAVEDKLQDDVSTTIRTMKEAGLKFFILTGDKKQTAVNIGRSCGLISQSARIVSYPEEDSE